PFENATRARWGRRRAIRKERRRDSVRAHVEEVRRGGWPAAAPNPKGWAGNGHRAASLVVDSRDKACLLLVPCAVAVPGPARSCGVLKRSLASAQPPDEQRRRHERGDGHHHHHRGVDGVAHDALAVQGQRAADAGEDESHLAARDHPRPTARRSTPPPSTPAAHACLPSTAASVSSAAKPSTPGVANAARLTLMPISTKNTGTRKPDSGSSSSFRSRFFASRSRSAW